MEEAASRLGFRTGSDLIRYALESALNGAQEAAALNEYFGRVERDGKTFPDMAAYTALDENRQILRELPDHSKQIVAPFVEQVQDKCSRLSDQDLSRTVEIYAKRDGVDWKRGLRSVRSRGASTAGGRDPEDWPILASALALGCPIWTEDTDFFRCGVATWTSDRVRLFLER